MAACLALALALALACLAGARFLEAPHWIYALVGTGAACGLALCLACGLILRRLLGSGRWRMWAALGSAAGAVVARESLLAELNRDPVAAVTIQFGRLALASSSVVGEANTSPMAAASRNPGPT